MTLPPADYQAYPAAPRPTKYCPACGRVVDAAAVVCPYCGVPQPAMPGLGLAGLGGPGMALVGGSDKRIAVGVLLCFFLGVFGVHRFYAGRVATGVLQLLTLGGLGIWWLIDMILWVTGSFRDGDGQRITEWT